MFAIVVDATGVGDSGVGYGVMPVGAGVFGNFEGKLVILRDALDDVVQTAGIDLPSDLGEWAVFSHRECEAHGIVGDFGGSCGCGSRDETTEVIVDTDIVERSDHPLFIAALEAHGLGRSAVDEGLRVAAAERCFEKPDIVESVEAFGCGRVLGRRGVWSCGGHAEGRAYF